MVTKMKMFGFVNQNKHEYTNRQVKNSIYPASTSPSPSHSAYVSIKQFSMTSIMRMQSTGSGCKSCGG